MMKIDIPEHWNVRAISLANGRVRIDTAAHSAYELTRDNVGKLSFEILDNGQKTDDELGKRHVNRR